MVGIARAFLGAGARSVIASLWSIDDKATLAFMKVFYEYLAAGQSASMSLHQAMKWISSHQLRIETGRYENIPRNERICHFCTSNKIEDENHFLLDCKAYSQIRDIFFSKLETKIPDFKSLSHDTLISLLMNSSDYLINCQLISFILQCFELRTKLISMNE